MEISIKDQWPLNLTFKDVPVGSAYLALDGAVYIKTSNLSEQANCGSTTVLCRGKDFYFYKVGDNLVAEHTLEVVRIFTKMELS